MSTPAEKEPLERRLSVINGLGLHARAAARIAETVQAFDCQVMLSKDGNQADGSSVLSLLTLDAPQGCQLLAQASGPQALEALDALEALFGQRFGEEK